MRSILRRVGSQSFEIDPENPVIFTPCHVDQPQPKPTKRREKTTITRKRATMADEDDDAATLLQRLLDDLLIYTPNSLLEPSKSLPSIQDLAAINSASSLRALQILRLYIRPRNEVLRIRRAVTAAFENEEVDSGNVYARHALLKRELEELRNEKSVLEEELRTIRGNSSRGNGIQNILVGEMILQKSRKQLQMLRIYKQHLKILLGKEEKVDNQTTLVPSPPPPPLCYCVP